MRGFSLIETLVVLVLITLLYALSGPIFQTLFAKTNAQIIKKELLNAIQTAQQFAELYHVPIVLCHNKTLKSCDGDWQNGYVIFLNPERNGVLKDKKKLLLSKKWHDVRGKIYLRTFPFYRQYLLFLPAALNNTDNGTIWFCAEGEHKPRWIIAMTHTGLVRERKLQAADNDRC